MKRPWPQGRYLVMVGGLASAHKRLTDAKRWADARNRDNYRVRLNGVIVLVGTDTWYQGRADVRRYGAFTWTRHPAPSPRQGCLRGR